MAKKAPKKVVPKVDGLSPKDLQKIRNAVRQIWQRSHPRKLCVARATGDDGFPFCEECDDTVPKITVDHIVPVGDLLDGGVERMFVASTGLRALCKKCHSIKTKRDNASTRAKRKQRSRRDVGDFY